MFYNGSIDNKLRFGDVVRGYPSFIPKLSEPFGIVEIDFQIPQYSVVLDPCCETGEGVISLSPLERVSPQFFDIAYLAKDITLLNRQGMAKDFTHPITWNKFSDKEKSDALIAAPEYGQKSIFIYEGNPLFPGYNVNRQDKYNEVMDLNKLPKYEVVKQPTVFGIRHRMISLKTIYHVKCRKIVRPDRPIDEAILSSIVLQLSVETRELLRQKVAYYFRKPPDEDMIET